MDLREEVVLHEIPCAQSSSPHRDSDSSDEDAKRELEEMLYSTVHYDSSAIIASDSAVIEQLDTPGRRKATRYYDVNLDQDQQESSFIIPLPVKERISYTHRRLNRSNNNNKTSRAMVAAQPRTTYTTGKHMEKEAGNNNSSLKWKSTAYVDKQSVQMQTGKKHPNLSSKPQENNRENFGKELNVSLANSNAVRKDANALESSVNPFRSPHASGCLLDENNESVIIETQSIGTSDTSIESQTPAPSLGGQSNLKKKNDQEIMEYQVEKRKLIDAQSSQVVSSMLDEESSSVDESSFVPTRASQAKGPVAESGWSVGMSWFDMSSSNFEVESVDDESLCSFPAHGSPTPVGSCANTPDLQSGLKDVANTLEHVNTESNLEPEPSKYNSLLKSSECLKGEAENNQTQGDTDSEEDSVIEMTVPPKPPPVVVDVSDCDDGAQMMKGEKHIDLMRDHDGDEIVFICAKPKRKSRVVPEVVVSDEDVAALPTHSGDQEHLLLKPNLVERYHRASGQGRNLKSQTNCGIQVRSSTSQSDTYLESDEFKLWLDEPIRASKSYDHHKLLKKMSSDPLLWKICAQDKGYLRFPSHGPMCKNCNRVGHMSHVCPEPRKVSKCHMCGTPGHRESRCPKKMCLRCGKPNYVFTDTCAACVKQRRRCQICKSSGHIWKNCPDLWRRYHLTITSGDIIKPEGDDCRSACNLWCSNCAKKGHLSHECHSMRWKCESISPYIESYLSPADEESRIIVGPSKATILLANEDAELLKTPESNTFILELSLKTNVSINVDINGSLKRLEITGSIVGQEEARFLLMEWLAPKRKASSESRKKRHSKITPCSDFPLNTEQASSVVGESQLDPGKISTASKPEVGQKLVCMESTKQGMEITSETFLGPSLQQNNQSVLENDPSIHHNITQCAAQISPYQKLCVSQPVGCFRYTACVQQVMRDLPKSRSKLISYIQSAFLSLRCANGELTAKGDTSVCGLLQRLRQNPPTNRSKLTRLCKAINIRLLGLYQVGPGRDYVEALKDILGKLSSGEKLTKQLRSQVAHNYAPVFTGYYRDDYEDLVQHVKKVALDFSDNVESKVNIQINPSRPTKPMTRSQSKGGVVTEPSVIITDCPVSPQESILSPPTIGIDDDVTFSQTAKTSYPHFLINQTNSIRKYMTAQPSPNKFSGHEQSRKSDLKSVSMCPINKSQPRTQTVLSRQMSVKRNICIMLKILRARFITGKEVRELSSICKELGSKNLSSRDRKSLMMKGSTLLDVLSRHYNIPRPKDN